MQSARFVPAAVPAHDVDRAYYAARMDLIEHGVVVIDDMDGVPAGVLVARLTDEFPEVASVALSPSRWQVRFPVSAWPHARRAEREKREAIP